VNVGLKGWIFLLYDKPPECSVILGEIMEVKLAIFPLIPGICFWPEQTNHFVMTVNRRAGKPCALEWPTAFRYFETNRYWIFEGFVT